MHSTAQWLSHCRLTRLTVVAPLGLENCPFVIVLDTHWSLMGLTILGDSTVVVVAQLMLLQPAWDSLPRGPSNEALGYAVRAWGARKAWLQEGACHLCADHFSPHSGSD